MRETGSEIDRQIEGNSHIVSQVTAQILLRGWMHDQTAEKELARRAKQNVAQSKTNNTRTSKKRFSSVQHHTTVPIPSQFSVSDLQLSHDGQSEIIDDSAHTRNHAIGQFGWLASVHDVLQTWGRGGRGEGEIEERKRNKGRSRIYNGNQPFANARTAQCTESQFNKESERQKKRFIELVQSKKSVRRETAKPLHCVTQGKHVPESLESTRQSRNRKDDKQGAHKHISIMEQNHMRAKRIAAHKKEAMAIMFQSSKHEVSKDEAKPWPKRRAE